MLEWGSSAPRGGFRAIPREVWVMAWDCVADGTGKAIRYWMGRELNKVAVGAARRAALVDEQGSTRRSWADLTARRVMTLELVLLRMAAPTVRKGRWGSVVRGVTVPGLARCLTPPGCGARVPHRNALTGRHRGAGSDSRRGQAGYLRALEATGALYAQQLPAAECEPFELCGPSGYAANRYWLVTETPTAPMDALERALLISLHRQGRLAPTERLEAPRNPAKTRAQHPVEPPAAPS